LRNVCIYRNLKFNKLPNVVGIVPTNPLALRFLFVSRFLELFFFLKKKNEMMNEDLQVL